MKKNKTYTLKPTKKQLKVMKEFWNLLKEREEKFLDDVYNLEQEMQLVSGIEDLEFFKCDGDYVGIGNVDRTMNLIQQEDLEK